MSGVSSNRKRYMNTLLLIPITKYVGADSRWLRISRNERGPFWMPIGGPFCVPIDRSVRSPGRSMPAPPGRRPRPGGPNFRCPLLPRRFSVPRRSIRAASTRLDRWSRCISPSSELRARVPRCPGLRPGGVLRRCAHYRRHILPDRPGRRQEGPLTKAIPVARSAGSATRGQSRPDRDTA